MKTTSNLTLLFVATLLLLPLALRAADEIVAGPNGGRLLEATPNRAEFFVNADRQVEITFYDESLNPVAPSGQSVTVIAEAPAGRRTLPMSKTATGFVSEQPLPPGEPYRVVVQVRPTAEARPQNFRVAFDLEPCAECQYAEYACTCGH